jgi:insulysin
MTEHWYRLYTVLVTDALIEYSYDAALAGLSYSIESSSLGFYVTVSGYNDKLHVLLRDVLEKAKSLEVRAERLEVIKEKVCNISHLLLGIRSICCAQIKRDWENFFLGQSYQLSDYYGRYFMNEKQWTISEKLQVLDCEPFDLMTEKENLIDLLFRSCHSSASTKSRRGPIVAS